MLHATPGVRKLVPRHRSQARRGCSGRGLERPGIWFRAIVSPCALSRRLLLLSGALSLCALASPLWGRAPSPSRDPGRTRDAILSREQHAIAWAPSPVLWYLSFDRCARVGLLYLPQPGWPPFFVPIPPQARTTMYSEKDTNEVKGDDVSGSESLEKGVYSTQITPGMRHSCPLMPSASH